MTYIRNKQQRFSVFTRILVLALLMVSFNHAAMAAPPLWEDSYNINATELVGPSGLGGRQNIALGFDFPFGGNNYSHILVESDGAIILANSASETSNVLPTIWKKDIFEPGFSNFGGGSARPLLLPFGTGIDQNRTGGITYLS
jgi:hypothetical protein